MNLSTLGLLFVIFVDVAGQGLILPIINTLVMDPSTGLLPASAPVSERHFSYGLVIGAFYLSWFLGAVYVSKISDSIGRKNGILICLAGALAGYVLTILAVIAGSLWLMILGRVVTGFTAGSIPIAQAALADLSDDDAERTRNMGYSVTALSVGLVAGPIIAGVMSDSALIGGVASLNLPFYTALALVLIAALLIVLFFDDKLDERVPLQIRPLEVFLLLWEATQRTTVLRISLVFFFFMFVWNTCFIFIDNYLSTRFDIGTLGTSTAMAIFGVALIFASAVLVSVVTSRFSKQTTVVGSACVMVLATAAIIVAPSPIVVYVAIVPLAAGFAVGYPSLLSIYSASVDNSEQGWVMGVSTALWTLGAGVTSLIGGDLMALDVHFPYYIAVGSGLMSIILVALVWRSPDVCRIARGTAATES